MTYCIPCGHIYHMADPCPSCTCPANAPPVSAPEKPPVVSCMDCRVYGCPDDGPDYVNNRAKRHCDCHGKAPQHPVSAEEKPMEHDPQAKGPHYNRPDCHPVEKPMDTPMTPEEEPAEDIKQAAAQILYGRPLSSATTDKEWRAWKILAALIAQRDALLLKRLQDELDRAENKVELFRPRLAALEEENARLRSCVEAVYALLSTVHIDSYGEWCIRWDGAAVDAFSALADELSSRAAHGG